MNQVEVEEVPIHKMGMFFVGKAEKYLCLDFLLYTYVTDNWIKLRFYLFLFPANYAQRCRLVSFRRLWMPETTSLRHSRGRPWTAVAGIFRESGEGSSETSEFFSDRTGGREDGWWESWRRIIVDSISVEGSIRGDGSVHRSLHNWPTLVLALSRSFGCC